MRGVSCWIVDKGYQGALSQAYTEVKLASADGNCRATTVSFNAAQGNSIYENSTLQPSAFQTLIIIKIWKAFDWTLDPLYKEFDALAVNFMSYIEKWVPSEIVLYK